MFNDNAVEEIDIDNDNDENDADNEGDDSEAFVASPSNGPIAQNANLVPPPPPHNQAAFSSVFDGHAILPSPVEDNAQHPIHHLAINPLFYSSNIQVVGRPQGHNQLNLIALPPLQIPVALPASGSGSPTAMSPTLDAPLSVDEGEEFNEFPELEPAPQQNNE
jgi:hypothetical protein